MDERWLEHYDPGVPRSIVDYPDRTLVDFVAAHARERGSRPAITFKGRSLTFREIHEASDALAHSLVALGLKKGDRVALVLPNAPQFIIAELAVWKAGAMIAPQNPIYTERELEESFVRTEPAFAIVLTPFYERVKAIQARTAIRRVIATNIKEYLPPLLRLLFTIAKEKKEGHRVWLRDGDLWLDDLIAEGRPKGPFASVALSADPAVVLMSGGTTGTPKGAVSDHRSIVMSGVQLLAWLREALPPGRSSMLLPLPLFHTYGCNGAQSMTLIDAIRLILIPNPRDTSDLLATIHREKPSLVCSVPALFNAMLAHPDTVKGKIDFRSITACFSGAAALMAETKRRFEEKTGGRIVEGYSLTEATMACCVNPFRGPNKLGSVGMPISDIRIRIVDSEQGTTELPAGELGEILLSAPQLMLGYWNDPAATEEAITRDPDGQPWLHTGDLGYLDEDGYVFLVDRKKDLIKTSGFQVWPREIEEVIASHPAVAEVGAAGIPDERKGEVVAAWVVLRSGATVTDAELRQLCRENLAPYKVPARIEFRNELPKTMIGKVLRRTLVAEAAEAAKAAAD